MRWYGHVERVINLGYNKRLLRAILRARGEESLMRKAEENVTLWFLRTEKSLDQKWMKQ